jgi:uncharacterized membrane protein
MQQDASYGIRQLADVALVALSPGVNDPTTAQDAIFHLAAVMREVLRRDLPPSAEHDGEDRWLVRAERPTHDDLLDLAFDEIRRASSDQPTVSVYLLEALHLLDRSLPERQGAARLGLRRHARLVLRSAEHADLLPADLDVVREAYQHRFPAP